MPTRKQRSLKQITNFQLWIDQRTEKHNNYLKFKHLRITIRNLNSTIARILLTDQFEEHDIIYYPIYLKYDITDDQYYSIIMQRIIQRGIIIVRNTQPQDVPGLRLFLIRKTSIEQFESGAYIPTPINQELYQSIIDKRNQT